MAAYCWRVALGKLGDRCVGLTPTISPLLQFDQGGSPHPSIWDINFA